jgi:hypothetical protein
MNYLIRVLDPVVCDSMLTFCFETSGGKVEFSIVDSNSRIRQGPYFASPETIAKSLGADVEWVKGFAEAARLLYRQFDQLSEQKRAVNIAVAAATEKAANRNYLDQARVRKQVRKELSDKIRKIRQMNDDIYARSESLKAKEKDVEAEIRYLRDRNASSGKRREIPEVLSGVLLLDEVSIHTRGSGIYFLCEGFQIVYVGQAKEVARRVVSHVGHKTFTHAFYYPCRPEELYAHERCWIEMLLPKCNMDSETVAYRDKLSRVKECYQLADVPDFIKWAFSGCQRAFGYDLSALTTRSMLGLSVYDRVMVASWMARMNGQESSEQAAVRMLESLFATTGESLAEITKL